MEFLYEQFGFFSREELRIKTEAIMIAASQFKPDIIDWQQIFCSIDHTSLDSKDDPGKIADFATHILELGNSLPGKSHVAAVCVYPVFVADAMNALKGSPVLTASVAGAFPSGLSPLAIRLQEARYALDQGADEIDMVISRGRLLTGDYNYVYDEIASFREACGKKTLKVILETGELNDPLQIARASEIALRAGADFLKTSTGKIPVGSTPEALCVMMDCLFAFYEETGQRKGLKAAGGLSEPQDALDILTLVRQKLGENWVHPSLLRIGTSKLSEKIAKLILNDI